MYHQSLLDVYLPLLGYWLLVFLLHSSASYLDYAGSAMKIKQGKP